MTPDDRRRVAIHEAGHAVADIVLGLPLEYASTRAGRTFSGITVAERTPVPGIDGLIYPTLFQPAELRAHVERRIVSMLAGELAEVYLSGSRGGYTSDDAQTIAREALAGLGPRLAELVVAHEECEESTGNDLDNAHGLAGALAGPESAALYVGLLRHEASALVIRYRAAILRVADELERVAILSGPAVAALVFPGRILSPETAEERA